MNIPAQLKINLSPELQGLLQSKASKFGVPLTQYVKHVLMKDVEDMPYPVLPASDATEKATTKALRELPHLKATQNIHEYFKKL